MYRANQAGINNDKTVKTTKLNKMKEILEGVSRMLVVALWGKLMEEKIKKRKKKMK